MFDLRKLEAFCKVYEQRSFSRAGQLLFLSQPTVSAHVQSLEKDAGVKLLDRMGRTVLPTPAGTVMYNHAIRAFEELEKAKSEISRLMGEVAGDVVLGASTIPAMFLLPDILTAFLRQYANVRISMRMGDSSNVAASVLRGETMLGIVGAVEDEPDLEYTKIIDDELIVVASASLDIRGNKKEYDIDAALAWPWVQRKESSGTRRSFESHIARAGGDPRSMRPVLQVDSNQAAVQYALAGLGVTVTSRLAVRDELVRGSLRELKVRGVKPLRAFYAVRNIRREFFPAAAAFTSFLQEQAAHKSQAAEENDNQDG